MTTPVLAPPEAQPSALPDDLDSPIKRPDTDSPHTETLSRPFRLGLVGLGASVGLFVRLLAANTIADLTLDSRTVMVGAALTSGLMGLGLLLMASERDRFGPPLAWIAAITSLAWGALNWISPPFAESVTVWSNPDQVVLAVLGLGNGLLLSGIVALAFVRRHPTLSVAAIIVASVFALAANTVVLRDEWPAIVSLGVTFALILLAWDRSPRRELAYARPQAPPRVSRAALSFISVALCGTAIQLWLSRTDIPRSIAAIVICAGLIVGAFVTLVGVRREIEKRETTLSEWTSWAREIRTNDFRAEMQNFESDGSPTPDFDARRKAGVDGQAPRPLSFPNLSIPDTTAPSVSTIRPDTAPPAGAPSTGPAPGTVSAGETIDSAKTAPTTGLSLTPDTIPSAGAIPDTELRATDGAVPAAALPAAELPAKVLPATALPGANILVPDTAVPGRSEQRASSRLPPIDTPAPVVPAPVEIIPPAATAAPAGAFSAMLASPPPVLSGAVQLADLDALNVWLTSPAAAARVKPLLVAIEALSLDEFESLPPQDAAMATQEIGSFLADTMPDADLVSWIDGPYFIVAHASKPDAELSALNRNVRKSLKATAGTLAFLRPGPDAVLDQIVNEAVMGLLNARHAEERAAGR